MCLRLPYHQCACVEILSNISKLTLLPDVIHLGLVQLLSINYMEKLGDSSTVDALDGNLKDFKPPGTFFVWLWNLLIFHKVEHEASYGCC